MNSAQQAAFQAGSGVSPASLLAAIAAVTLTLAIIWAVWVVIGSFRAWQGGQADLFDLAWATLRASIILMVLGFYLR